MTCESLKAHLAARAAGEDLPGAEALDRHLADCAACRAELASWTALSGRLGADLPAPDPSRRARLRAATRSHLLPRLAAVAAGLLLALGILLTRSGRAPAPPEDWRLAFLDARAEASGVMLAPGLNPLHRQEMPQAPPGGPGGKPAGAAWSAPEGMEALSLFQTQFPRPLWIPEALPPGMALASAQVARPGPGRKAAVIVFAGGGRRLLLFQEASAATAPLSVGPGRRTASFLRDGLAVTVAAEGFDESTWRQLSEAWTSSPPH